jgi:hypothetical protein
VITIPGIDDHLRPEWLITITGIRNETVAIRYDEGADGHDALFDKDLPQVATEMALAVLAYNLTRVMNIVGIKPLIAAVGA